MDKNTRKNDENNHDNPVEKPIFITGAPRSGLGIIHQILTSHDQVSSFTSNLSGRMILHFRRIGGIRYFMSLLGNYPLLAFMSIFKNLIHNGNTDWIQSKETHFWNKNFEPYIYATDSHVTNEITNYYRFSISRIQHITDRPRFISTMSEHSFRIIALNTIFPDAKFIHIIRDQRIVSCSTFAKSRNERSILNDDPYFHNLHKILGDVRYDESLELFNYELAAQIIVKRAREANVFGSQRYLELRYEDLVSDPTQSLSKILSFCELSQNPEYVRKNCLIVRNENEKWYQYLNT
jgi:omega-hydroxy-beta-dihydromenaquinone-9 sulfotransferase